MFVFPFLVLKKSSGALNHFMVSVDCFRTHNISGGFVKEKPRSLSLNQIAKEEPGAKTYIIEWLQRSEINFPR